MKSWTIMTKNPIAALACLLAFATLQIALAQVVERPRPAGWENLVVIFPPVELDSPVVEALGREKSGRLFFATCRTDGTKLGWYKHE